MARSLPVHLKNSPTTVTASSSAPSETANLDYGQAGVAIVGCGAALASTGGKVTVTLRDGDHLTNSPTVYQVEFDFTSTQQSLDIQAVAIPCFNEPSYTVQADATANGKIFNFGVYLQKIAVQD